MAIPTPATERVVEARSDERLQVSLGNLVEVLEVAALGVVGSWDVQPFFPC
jgi:hypothetical protein